jgi:copper chaperone CopZ
LGRWISEDPFYISLNEGLESLDFDIQNSNSYAYARNNPLSYIDVTGEAGVAIEQRRIISANLNSSAGVIKSYPIPKLYYLAPTKLLEQLAIRHIAGDTIHDISNLINPDASTTERAISGAFIVMDIAQVPEVRGVGEIGASAKTINKAVKVGLDSRPGRVTQAVKELNVSSRAIKGVKDIAGFTKEGIDQVVSRGLKPNVIKDTLVNTTRVQQRVDQFGRESFRYIGEKAVLNFNKAKQFITGWLRRK